MNDDINTPRALAVLWNLVRDRNAEGKIKTIRSIDEVFGLSLLEKENVKLPKNINNLVNEREKARKLKDWKRSDYLRDKIRDLGWLVEDTEKGSVIKRLRL